MENILSFIVLVFILMEASLIMFCDYWRDNNPWKWFIIKTLTTFLIVIWICFGKEHYDAFEVGIALVLGFGMGMDFINTLLQAKNIRLID